MTRLALLTLTLLLLPACGRTPADPDPGYEDFRVESFDLIDQTGAPTDETILIKLGDAFDIVGERTQVDFTIDNRRDTMTETVEIMLRNRKDEPVDVIALERLYRWTNWEVTEQSHDFEKQDSRTVHFPVSLAANGKPGHEVTVRYTVRYTW